MSTKLTPYLNPTANMKSSKEGKKKSYLWLLCWRSGISLKVCKHAYLHCHSRFQPFQGEVFFGELMWLVFLHYTHVPRGPESKVTMEFEENKMRTNCLWLLWNLLAWATMSRGCHRSENKLPEGAGWETIDECICILGVLLSLGHMTKS